MLPIPLARLEPHRGQPMTAHSAISLGLSVVTLALIGACAGGGSNFADAGLDARWSGTCDPDRVRPGNALLVMIRDCAADSDCLDGVNGRCTLEGPYTVCTYDECFSDADCPAGSRCACGVQPLDGNMCRRDHCASCGADECAISWGCEGHSGGVYGVQSFECYTPDDSCHTDADCASAEFCTRGPDLPSEEVYSSWHCASVRCAF